MFFLSCVCYAFVHVCLFVSCGHLLGKGSPHGSSLWCLIVSSSLSHWYPGSGVVLESIPDLCTLTYFDSVIEAKFSNCIQYYCGEIMVLYNFTCQTLIK